DVCGPEPLLAHAVDDLDGVDRGGEPVGDLARAVRRVVVDDEHVDAERDERADHPLDVLALVVGGEAHRDPHGAPYHRCVAQTLPRNGDVAAQLELLADILELEGEAGFRVIAYRRAATRVRETSGPVAALAIAGKAKELPGIGATIEEKIVQIVDDG